MAHALLRKVIEESWILEQSRIRVDGQIRLEYVICGCENFLIQQEKFVDSKISGYVRAGSKETVMVLRQWVKWNTEMG